ncbi:PLP-dependent aminotransferase family protein [Actinocorallia sp. A-T 12471]|uniref:MocR-like transcription factor YczR n=1 Tax=Actinocorallia sp. A-T 12471 TaxID=3089813 RepID=UPI0029D14A24|nr:PLP-dependent aminotransferase family protein [Actinocorallia sp. A-T 12471]MDX6741398.1 PLP-dependent aminotransferase family protein [Actinocorallia sp. A-T 12471]
MSEVRYVGGVQLARLLGPLPSERPLYAALSRGIRTLVQDGRLPLGVRLPAERDLAGALGVSRTTVTSAYDDLREDGFVSSRQGAGSWTALPAVSADRPGGPAFTASPRDAQPGTIDLGCASHAAPAVFPEAVEAAVAQLPLYTCGPGYEPAGLLRLREAIADRYTERGLPTRPEEIVVTNGAQQAWNLLVQTLVRPGEPVMVERPTYPHALGALRNRGALLATVGVSDGWDVELLADGMRQSGVRLAYLIPDFQNPTGHLMSADDRAAVVEASRASKAQIVVDETFAELSIDAAAPMPPMASFDGGGRVISVGSASKLFWGGLRVGWIRTTIPLAQRLATLREPMDIAPPVMEQLITAELFCRVEEVRAERRAQLGEARDALVAALRARVPDWTFTVPEGGMCLWARLPFPVATCLSETALRHGVRVIPGPMFGADGVLEDYLRLPFAKSPDQLREAVTRLAAAYEGTGVEIPVQDRQMPACV